MRIRLICLLIIFTSSCSNYDDNAREHPLYFDIGSYFKEEAIRLTKANKTIYKTVIVNGKAEQKKLTVTNWQQEFSSFIDADINKASWRGSFNYKKLGQIETYTSDYKKIPVKKLTVTLEGKKVKSIKIFILNTNDLYTSKDSLIYFPDSLYFIQKIQKIKLMDGKQYQVIGKFK